MVMLLSHFKWGGTTAAKILTQAFRKAENEERMQTVCFVMEISIALIYTMCRLFRQHWQAAESHTVGQRLGGN